MANDSLASPESRIIPFFVLPVIAGFFVFAIQPLQPPTAVLSGSPAEEFSAERAAAHLEHTAQAPHPTGSAENARVRAYLVAELAALGLVPEVQTTASFRAASRIFLGATVSNVIGRLGGSNNSKALMLAAHYDSVPGSPGASDDGSGVATLLETVRALQAGPRLQNDLIILLTDGEELGLLGARAFVTDHAWAKDVGVVLNFEARGSGGPSMMFETSAGNSWLLRQFAETVPYPAAYSFMYEFYRRMPNDTDFTEFRKGGMAGLNFAYGDGWVRYHTAKDDLPNLDLNSLQHDGSYALALSRRFGNLDLTRVEDGDAVYFNLFGRTVHYRQGFAFPLAAAAALLFGAVVALGLRNGRLSWRGMLLGSAGWLAAALFSAAAAHYIWRMIAKTSLTSLSLYGIGYNSGWYAWAFLVLAAAIVTGACVAMRDLTSGENLTAGLLLWWLVATLVTGVFLPGTSYLFTWPLVPATVVLHLVLRETNPLSLRRNALLWLIPAFVCVFVVTPMPYGLLKMLGTSGLVPLMLATALLVGFLQPLVQIVTRRHKGWMTVFLTTVALLLFGTAVTKRGYDADNPAPDSLFYYLDKDTGKALWLSADAGADEWTSQCLGTNPSRGNLRELFDFNLPTLHAPAPAAEIEEPRVGLIRAGTDNEVRRLRLLVTAPLQTRALWLDIHGAEVLEAAVNGKKVIDQARNAGLQLYYAGIPEDGLILTLGFPSRSNPELRVVAQRDGLPAGLLASPASRPAHLMPLPWPPFDSSALVSKTFRNLAALPPGQEPR